MAFVDLRVVDELNFRVGRFTPAFGDFPLRHDPANHRTSDKPLPYDMGRMLRLREWNMGVLPSPYVDQGIEVNGTHWFGEHRAARLRGVRGRRPARGPGRRRLRLDRVALGVLRRQQLRARARRAGRAHARPDRRRDARRSAPRAWPATWTPSASTATRSAASTCTRASGCSTCAPSTCLRRTEMPLGDDPDARFRYGPGEDGEYDDYFLKDGFYVEANLAALHAARTGRPLRRAAAHGQRARDHSTLREEQRVLRYTGGLNIVFDGSVRLKLSGEFYDFSDFSDEVAANTGVVAAF